jgi:NAD(P)-dependent dehydrogenase (short-subunit alcohol dehydrogenase family)
MTFPLPNASLDLKGQVALVTGCSSGLGWRFAQVLAAQGASVAVTARRTERLEALAKDIRSRGGECVPIALDIQDPKQIVAAVDAAEKALGVVTILVNNAGIPDAQHATKQSLELVNAVFDTNLRGPYILSCEVARRLIKAKQPGRMVNIASVGAFRYTGGGGAALYSITKAGIVRMTEALSAEWAGYHINVNCIAPGAFMSEMMEGMLSRIGDISKGFPRRRIADPAQMDSTLLYLVAPSSDAVTGTTITIDDGQGPK